MIQIERERKREEREWEREREREDREWERERERKREDREREWERKREEIERRERESALFLQPGSFNILIFYKPFWMKRNYGGVKKLG